MKNFFKIHNMKSRIVRAVYAITIVIVTIFFAALNIKTINSRKNDYRVGCMQRAATASKEADAVFSQMIYMESSISSFPDIMNILKRERTGSLYDKYVATSRIEEILDVYKNSMETENTIVIYPTISDIPESVYVNSIEHITDGEKQIAKELNKSYKSLWRYSEENNEIALYKGIFEQERVLGYLKIGINGSMISATAEKMRAFEDEYICIETQNGRIVYEKGDKCGNLVEASLLNGGTIKIGMSTRKIYFREKSFVLISLVCYVIFCFALYVIYKGVIGNVTSELYNFLEEISKTDNILEKGSNIKIDGDGEIDEIKRQFKSLIEKLLESNIQKEQMKFDMLQNGINPHLLYNSLSALRWRMLKQKQNDIAEVIECMANYYRNVLSKGENIITLGRELEIARQYVTISEFCYKRKYNYIVNVADDLLELKIIKLVIQPFVENAIMHGISNMDDGIVILNINKEEDVLVIDITDNGYGISEETLKNIKAGIPSSKYSGYAIKNTVGRIKSHYGEEYGVAVESELNKGTHVEIKIPTIYN